MDADLGERLAAHTDVLEEIEAAADRLRDLLIDSGDHERAA
ncbi:hypothetical protein ACFYWO_26535 [Streptomyces sp. NPDC002932]